MDNDTNPTTPTTPDKGSRIKKADKDQIMRNVLKSFQQSFPQLELDDVQGLTKYFGELMCRKIAKTPLYAASGTVTIQTLRDAFAAVLAERILHKDIVLKDSVPTSPTAAYVVCGATSPFDTPAQAMTEINPQPPEEDPRQQKFDFAEDKTAPAPEASVEPQAVNADA